MKTSDAPRKAMARNPSHFGSKRKLPAAGRASASLASMGSIGGATGNASALGCVPTNPPISRRFGYCPPAVNGTTNHKGTEAQRRTLQTGLVRPTPYPPCQLRLLAFGFPGPGGAAQTGRRGFIAVPRVAQRAVDGIGPDGADQPGQMLGRAHPRELGPGGGARPDPPRRPAAGRPWPRTLELHGASTYGLMRPFRTNVSPCHPSVNRCSWAAARRRSELSHEFEGKNRGARLGRSWYTGRGISGWTTAPIGGRMSIRRAAITLVVGLTATVSA